MTDEINRLKVGISTDGEADYGPLVTNEHRNKVEDYIQMGIDEGAELVVDEEDLACKATSQGLFSGHHSSIK